MTPSPAPVINAASHVVKDGEHTLRYAITWRQKDSKQHQFYGPMLTLKGARDESGSQQSCVLQPEINVVRCSGGLTASFKLNVIKKAFKSLDIQGHCVVECATYPERTFPIEGTGNLYLHIRELTRRSLDDGEPVFYSPRDDIDILCQFKAEFAPVLVNEAGRKMLLDGLLQTMGNPEIADFEVKVEDKTFPVVKGILWANCGHVRRMLQSGMLESQKNVWQISDFSVQTVEQMLKFLCTAVCEPSVELLAAADIYDIRPLKNFCEERLQYSLTKQNALAVLRTAFTHNGSAEFKAVALQYVVDNYGKFSQSEIDTFFSENGDLSVALIRRLMNLRVDA